MPGGTNELGEGLNARLATRFSGPGGNGRVDHGAFEYYTEPYSPTPRDFDSWATQRFIGIPGGPDDDSNNDGVTNFAAHFFGVPVFGATSGTDLRAELTDAGDLRLTYSKPFISLGTVARSQVYDPVSGWLPGPDPREIGSSTARRYFEVIVPRAGGERLARILLEEESP